METKTDPIRIHTRWMIRRDMPDVLVIEQASFKVAATEEDYLQLLRQRDTIGMVAEVSETEGIAGFFIYQQHKTRFHLLTLAVAPEYRRKGVGRAMVHKLIGKLGTHDYNRSCRERVVLEVCEENLEGQLFFRAIGFKATKVLHDYYEDTDQDAYRMEYSAAADKVADHDGLIVAEVVED